MELQSKQWDLLYCGIAYRRWRSIKNETSIEKTGRPTF